MDLRILPNKLRMVFPRQSGHGEGEEFEPDTPKADIPKGWGSFLHVTHVDIVVPGEHTIEGRSYVGEYRIYHIHKSGKGVVAMSIMMEINTEDDKSHNRHLQIALNQWRDTFDDHAAECESLRRLGRGLGPVTKEEHSAFDRLVEDDDEMRGLWEEGRTERWEEGQRHEEEEEKERSEINGLGGGGDLPFRRLRQSRGRRAETRKVINPDDPSDLYTSPGRWDPYQWGSILNTHWFWGYKGSLTEPPCTQFVNWRVMDRPMQISITQLNMIRKLIFLHERLGDDGQTCARTSNHHEGTANRPIRELGRRQDIYKCTCAQFTSDQYRYDGGPAVCREDEVDDPPLRYINPEV